MLADEDQQKQTVQIDRKPVCQQINSMLLPTSAQTQIKHSLIISSIQTITQLLLQM